jgi:hypothetical protein
MANLTGQNIKDTYQQLVTLGSGTTITNGTGSQITNLAVTSSWASNAVTASYALNAGVTVDTGSLMVTGSVSGNVLTFTKGNGSAFNLTVNTGSAVTVSTASLMVTASAAANVITFTKGDGSTFNVTVSQSGSVASASYATFAANAGALDGTPASGYARLIANNTFTGTTQTFTDIVSNGTASLTRIQAIGSEIFVDDKVVITSGDLNVQSGNVLVSNGSLTVLGGNISGSFVGSLTGNASTATSASHALNADRLGAQLPSHYATATSVTNLSSSVASRLTTDEAIITSLVAATGSYAKTNVNNSFSGLQTFNNIAVNGTASIGYLEAVTGSAKIIGDAYIILNNDTPAQRYAGIKVIDSGSANTTASLLFDGQTNDWFYEYESGDPTDFGVFLVGPEYGTLGNPIYPTANQIQKGTGTHHLTGSALSDDGTKVTVATSLESLNHISAVGYISANAGFTGSLNGNADTATSASFATYANTAGSATSATTATSASHALYSNQAGTATLATTATSASYAAFALTASYALNAAGGAGEASAESGNILFENIYGEIYGSAASPVTGNITVSGVSTKVSGSVAIIYHTAAAEPTISGATVNKKVGTYESGSLNIITLTNIDGVNILEYIAGGAVTNVPSASYADFALSASYAPHIQGLIQGNAADAGSLRSFIVGGASSIASGSDALSIGNSATATGYQAVAIGGTANAPEFASTAVGGNSKAEATLAVAVGSGATIRAYGGVGIGASTEAEGNQFGVAIGQAAKAYGQDTIAIGAGAVTAYPLAGQLVIGRSTSTGANEIIIGSGSTSYGANTVHIGNASITDTYLEGTIHGDGSGITGIVATSASYAVTASLATLTYNNNTASGSLGFWQGSQTEYNAISGSASNSIIYFII